MSPQVFSLDQSGDWAQNGLKVKRKRARKLFENCFLVHLYVWHYTKYWDYKDAYASLFSRSRMTATFQVTGGKAWIRVVDGEVQMKGERQRTNDNMVRQEQVDPMGIRGKKMVPGIQSSLGAWGSSRGQLACLLVPSLLHISNCCHNSSKKVLLFPFCRWRNRPTEVEQFAQGHTTKKCQAEEI